MGSSKTAQALMCRFNFMEKGFNVLLLKSDIDKRDMEDGEIVIKSRIGLSAKCLTFSPEENLFDFVNLQTNLDSNSIVIIDEAQFLTKEQVEQLKDVSVYLPVICYGLLTNFKTELFEGSKRLIEIADSLQELKSVCKCGNKANINARMIDGKLVTDGEEILLGGNSTYEAICFNCYNKLKQNQNNKNNKNDDKEF